MCNSETDTIKLAYTDQPYEVALLVGYKQDCNYCGINFVTKPNQVRFDYNPIGGLSVDIIWDKPILSRLPGDSSDDKILAVVGPNPRTQVLEVVILEVIDVMAYIEGIYGEHKFKCHCKRLIPSNPSLISRVKSAYRRNFLNDCELSAPLYSFDKLPELTVTSDARNCDTSVIENLKKEIQSISNEILNGLGVNLMIKNVPIITRCIINDPAVVIFWSDGTKTVGKCMHDDEFNPEIGLAMAISRKYYELIGFPNPRSAFKNQLKNAENQSAKTKEKRERKMKLLEAAKVEE